MFFYLFFLKIPTFYFILAKLHGLPDLSVPNRGWIWALSSESPDSSVHGISQARILEWVAISFSRGSSWPRNWTCVSCIGRQILYCWATRKAPCYQILSLKIENTGFTRIVYYLFKPIAFIHSFWGTGDQNFIPLGKQRISQFWKLLRSLVH